MKYIILALLLITLRSSASSINPWPSTESTLILVCRPLVGKDTYGDNEFIQDKQICRWTVGVKK